MGRKSASGGVTEHKGKIRLDIWYRGRRRARLLAWSGMTQRRAAVRMVGEIREKIRHGLLDFLDHFPEDSCFENLLSLASSLSTFRDFAKAWLQSIGQKAPATREDYRKALDLVWLDELGERPIKAIRYSELMHLSVILASPARRSTTT